MKGRFIEKIGKNHPIMGNSSLSFLSKIADSQ